MKIKCMIVDDEPIARDILKTYIDRIPEVSLVKSCINAAEAYEGLHEYAVDLVFLDIQMPVISGTEFLRSLRKPPLVVFTTAYSQYAVEGFDLNSVDYLLKPIVFERFYQAVQKAMERMQNHTQLPGKKEDVPDYLFIRQGSKLIRVNHSEISYIQAERDFCSVYIDNKRLLASLHLKILEDMLPQNKFFRVHRSYIVNMEKIAAVKGNIIELNNAEIPIGANYREHLFKKLHINAGNPVRDAPR
ncbi:MAG: LytR/AlgR family response regulator transcription factor [Mucilaginibacter sp.]|uniref:LytR/AlgR family response regulator transcription factor n=1 Tax=Mucilaginibacter sp. L3T2-6 TaxID=3062491 RepID=UPI002675D74D|nr:response regulator transcription factor [Mucilaginibacter sp. L3T2-6]MDO3643791.1 response regulator transcription factor [Mucilaginibacter sp. L3T2-6]MDV6216242.1 response regulator transcription factor [Mucilaginibacter sp. L3T2-6]